MEQTNQCIAYHVRLGWIPRVSTFKPPHLSRGNAQSPIHIFSFLSISRGSAQSPIHIFNVLADEIQQEVVQVRFLLSSSFIFLMLLCGLSFLLKHPFVLWILVGFCLFIYFCRFNLIYIFMYVYVYVVLYYFLLLVN